MEPRMDGEPQTAVAVAPGIVGARNGGFDGQRHSGGDASRDNRADAAAPPPSGVLAGLLLSRVSAFYLAAGAVMLVCAVLLFSAMAGWYLSQLSTEMLSGRFIAALLLAQVMVLIGSGLAARLLWQRSAAVMAVRKGERMVSRVMVVMLRSSGEVGALLLVFAALALGLLVIIAPDSLLQLIALPADTRESLAAYPLLLQWAGFVLLGIAIIAAGASLAAMVLLVPGFLAERLSLTLQVADDTRRMREQLEAFKGSDEVLRAFR